MPAKSSKQKHVKIVSSKVVYRGPAFQITSDQVKEPGHSSVVRRDVIRHSGSAVILPVDNSSKGEPRILLERQFRYSANQLLWELPAGGIDEGEDELPAAQRELLEETGYTAKKWKRVLRFYPSPGILDETMSVYLALTLTPGKAAPEEDELIRTRFFPLSQVVRMILQGKIIDAKTVCSVLWLDRALAHKKLRM